VRQYIEKSMLMIAKLEMMGKQMHGTLSQVAITLWIHMLNGEVIDLR
jgi:hypothetical protein